MAPRKILLLHKRAPGDTVVLTALVRDIALAHPGKFEIGVKTSAMSLWDHNPYIVQLKKPSEKKYPRDVEHITAQYGRGIRDQKFEAVHFMAYFHRDFYAQCKVRVPCLQPKPDLHLSDDERTRSLVQGRYWLFISGGKSDFTTKVWYHHNWIKLVKQLQHDGIPMVQAGALDKGHWHPDIPGVLNLVGKTNLRQLLQLIYHADGVVCGNTMAMHVAAALEKPCVVIAGGREAWWWYSYVQENTGFGPAAGKVRVPHRVLHTIGQLDCCERVGCWRNKSAPLHGDKLICHKPIVRPGQTVPRCLDMISPEMVRNAVWSYYWDSTLPAIPNTQLELDLEMLHQMQTNQAPVGVRP